MGRSQSVSASVIDYYRFGDSRARRRLFGVGRLQSRGKFTAKALERRQALGVSRVGSQKRQFRLRRKRSREEGFDASAVLMGICGASRFGDAIAHCLDFFPLDAHPGGFFLKGFPARWGGKRREAPRDGPDGRFPDGPRGGPGGGRVRGGVGRGEFRERQIGKRRRGQRGS
ncbi:MAG: hypothetical protein COR54_07025 [Elusimicrobia bacterium CG22_combo_CG10-13_8_21_14_all_63_91]|nr:MAG: hypothetical protein COR54_07025 [Elusimicrobia bacterium CG22_combo_CG10-13_8_21_14_all_63_91]